MTNPIHDFGNDSRIVEMTISRFSDSNRPTAHRRFMATIESGSIQRHFAFINPIPLSDVSAMMDAWGFRIIDQRLEGNGGIEFGRYWLQYMDDEDESPRHIQVDAFEELD